MTLNGHVRTHAKKVAVINAVKRISGVQVVVKKVEVQLSEQHRLTDEGLAERISHVITWNLSEAERNIKADVKNGVVWLSGKIE